MLLGLAIASFGVSWRRDLLAVFDQLHIQVLAAYDKAKRMEQSSSRSSGGPSPRGFPGGIPGIVDMSQTVLDMLAVFDQQQILAALVDDFPGLPLAPMDASRLSELRRFAEACKKDPSLRADPNLAFSKQAQAPKPQTSSMDDIDGDGDLNMRDGTPEPDELDEEIVESDLELEGDIVESDHNDPPQKMGDPSIEVTEENRDASQEAKGKLEEAVGHLTKAILLNPLSAIMYGTRASVFIKMEKPVTAIRDANAALEINPDSAKGYKTRGMAYAMLGKWEEAARDLRTASNMDYDDEINAVLKKVEPNAHKIMEHRRKYERLRKERKEKRAERDRLRRRAEAQATYDKAKRKEQSSSRSSGGPSPRGFPGGMPGGGFPGGMPGGGFPGMPGGGGMPRGGFPGGMPGGFPRGAMPGGVPGIGDLSQILNDLLAAFDELQIMAALQDVKNNPASFARHLANPKVRPILEEMMAEINGSQ